MKRVFIMAAENLRGAINKHGRDDVKNNGDMIDLEWSLTGDPPATHGCTSIVVSDAAYAKIQSFKGGNPASVVEVYDDRSNPSYLVDRMTELGFKRIHEEPVH